MLVLNKPAPTYVGPGDLVTGALIWGGLRAYTGAIAAAGTQTLVNVKRVSDNATADIIVSSATGGLGVTANATGGSNGVSAAVWAGVDATATGSISGTTLTMTASLHVGDQITGGTTANGTYIVSGSSPTWTVNFSQTVSSATLTATVGMILETLYDQTTNVNNFINTANGNAYLLAAGATPVIANFTSTQPLNSASAISLAATSTLYAVMFDVNTSSYGGVITHSTAYGIYSKSGEVNFFDSGDNLLAGTSHQNWYVTIGVIGSGGSINANGSSTSYSLALGASSATLRILSDGGDNPLDGFVREAGVWPSGFSSGNITSVTTNARTFWSF